MFTTGSGLKKWKAIICRNHQIKYLSHFFLFDFFLILLLSLFFFLETCFFFCVPVRAPQLCVYLTRVELKSDVRPSGGFSFFIAWVKFSPNILSFAATDGQKYRWKQKQLSRSDLILQSTLCSILA